MKRKGIHCGTACYSTLKKPDRLTSGPYNRSTQYKGFSTVFGRLRFHCAVETKTVLPPRMPLSTPPKAPKKPSKYDDRRGSSGTLKSLSPLCSLGGCPTPKCTSSGSPWPV